MTHPDDRSLPRAVRAAMPLAMDVIEEACKVNGVCLRPVVLKRTDTTTGKVEYVNVPCGATLAAKCEPCANRAVQLRKAQCREGWHLEAEPVAEAAEPTDRQRWLIEERADVEALRDLAEQDGGDLAVWDEVATTLEDELAQSGVRGHVLPGEGRPRRSRSTRRRQDAPDLPKRQRENRTVGRAFTAPDGRVYRPSLFVTLTCDSYGKVRANGTPVDPSTYDYVRAARDAIHFPKLVDRFVQNLRRVAGYDVQYFATVEPQKRLAPHLHMAVRGAMPRAEVKAVAAATYHQVWWPAADEVRYEGAHLPVWVGDEHATDRSDGQAGDYLDPETGEVLPTWERALDQLDADEDAEPLHVVRLGPQIDVKGVMAGSPGADWGLYYLTKYLTKSLTDCHEPTSDAQRAHVERLMNVLRYEPCAPTCPNWLRYGIQPKGAKAGMRPGGCRGKAHKPEHLGYAGRRVLVSRKWSGKTLSEHKQDRRAWVLEQLGLSTTDDQTAPIDPHRYIWRPVTSTDRGVPPRAKRLLDELAKRHQWRAALKQAQARADGHPIGELSATQTARRAA
ncbi:replication initiation protein [Sphaerisporangium album]|uniref:Replication initiation protein n=1 Tax=Sphaerisporangium album TaxID=509200 RepID=A0A367FFL8_9ACTN|nr:replication initiation protein [Sphaerisporangium album]